MGQFDFVRMALTPKFRPQTFGEQAGIDDPEQGKASIGGTGGGVIDLNYSMSMSVNRQHHVEAERRYDVVRTYYTRPDGTIDTNSFVEWEVVREVSFGNGDKEAYAKPQIAANMELMQEGLTRRMS